jgi:hypothetical protein
MNLWHLPKVPQWETFPALKNGTSGTKRTHWQADTDALFDPNVDTNFIITHFIHISNNAFLPFCIRHLKDCLIKYVQNYLTNIYCWWPTPLLARVDSSMLLQISYGEHHCDDHIAFANRSLHFVLPDKGVYGLFVELVQGPTLFSYMSPKQQEVPRNLGT